MYIGKKVVNVFDLKITHRMPAENHNNIIFIRPTEM